MDHPEPSPIEKIVHKVRSVLMNPKGRHRLPVLNLIQLVEEYLKPLEIMVNNSPILSVDPIRSIHYDPRRASIHYMRRGPLGLLDLVVCQSTDRSRFQQAQIENDRWNQKHSGFLLSESTGDRGFLVYSDTQILVGIPKTNTVKPFIPPVSDMLIRCVLPPPRSGDPYMILYSDRDRNTSSQEQRMFHRDCIYRLDPQFQGLTECVVWQSGYVLDSGSGKKRPVIPPMFDTELPNESRMCWNVEPSGKPCLDVYSNGRFWRVQNCGCDDPQTTTRSFAMLQSDARVSAMCSIGNTGMLLVAQIQKGRDSSQTSGETSICVINPLTGSKARLSTPTTDSPWNVWRTTRYEISEIWCVSKVSVGFAAFEKVDINGAQRVFNTQGVYEATLSPSLFGPSVKK